MALSQSYTDPDTQITLSYWDFLQLINDVLNNLTICSLGLYVSSSAKAAGATPLVTLGFQFSGNLNVSDAESAIIAASTVFTNATKI